MGALNDSGKKKTIKTVGMLYSKSSSILKYSPLISLAYLLLLKVLQ
jgi:hypothetical protein